MTALRSRKYLAGSRGAPCAFRIAGICRDERETVVPCHIRDSHAGRSIKASDLSVGNGCRRCHDVFDRRASMPDGNLISDADWHFYALRALQETLEQRRAAGLLFVPEDAARPFHERPAPARKPKAERKAIPHREADWPSRTIPSRPMRQEKR